ncbi:MAG: sigma-70 family RNA polymerase sigma factor [Termitinemataceae bacterium]|nr:MAG: sigma-70 family RNA polymerase sigma factor [Termitinemataceae bacterium]
MIHSEIELEDETIVTLVCSGSTDHFKLLIKRHERAVKGFGFSFFHNVQDSGDFAQEVFIKVFNSLRQFKGDSKFTTWLYRIAYTTAVNKINRRKEYVSLADKEIESAYHTPEDLHIRSSICEAVRKAVAGLEEKYRVCIDLFFFYDCTYEEIETITGFPVNTVKSHVFRAKKILKEKLSKLVEEGY